jgi:ribosomal protein S18 acetylase RimI-like enzyme
MTHDLTIVPATAQDQDTVVALWRTCGLVAPYNPPDADFEFARGKPGSDVLVGRAADSIVATVLVGHDGHRGWIYYVAVDPAHQGAGFGAHIVAAAEQWLAERKVRKVQLMVRSTNAKVIGFYDRLGYERSEVTVMQRWLEPGH